MKPRQLRALVMLLVLLPLVPTAFVIRFLAEAIYNERSESRERTKLIYQEFLTTSNASLATSVQRQVLPLNDPAASSTGRPPVVSADLADAVLRVAPDGRLSTFVPVEPSSSRREEAINTPVGRLEKALLNSGVHYTRTQSPRAARWRFLSDNPEPVFALHPADQTGVDGDSVVLIKTRKHLLESLGVFYSHALGPQNALRLFDENGDDTPLVGSPEASAGQVLAETLLPPPLPAWRVQLFNADTSLVDSTAREQITFSAWAVGGMVVVTGTIAALAGFHLRRRIALQEMRNDILAVVSHEMRTPLASSRIFIDTLLERRYHGGTEQADEYLRLIAQENSRLERLAESFLTLSRLDGQRNRGGGLKLALTHVEDIVEEAIDRLRPRLEAPGCRFEYAPGEQPVSFLADAEALTTVLVNLLENALKYTGDDKRITLRTHSGEGKMCFEITDNGGGIDPGEQRRIFERFYQSDQRLARSHDGCGLGLSLVQSIVRAHGGTVTVQSSLGKGSTFTVCLPLETVNGPPVELPAAAGINAG